MKSEVYSEEAQLHFVKENGDLIRSLIIMQINFINNPNP